jgi:hypothetical protein
MKLAVVHQVLIASALGLCAIFGLRTIVVGVRDGSVAMVALGLVSFAALVALALYLRRFREKIAEKGGKGAG